MAAIYHKAKQGYLFLFDELADQRLMTWPFVSKPYQVITLVALYLIFVLKWGPQWMKNRKPYNLDRVMIVYNLMQVLVCAYTFFQALNIGWARHYKWVCQPIDYSNEPIAVAAVKLAYLYFLTKVADLLDTVFFILRKKQNQVSFLHLYHHAGMVLLIWGAVTYVPGGHGTSVGVVNSFVHVVMYSYYLLTVAVPEVKSKIWMKKLVTQLQILQFFSIFIHMSTLLFVEGCEYPRWVCAIFLPQNFFLTVLFTDFYIKTYIKKPKVKETRNKTICAKKSNGHYSKDINKNYVSGNGDIGNSKDIYFLKNNQSVFQETNRNGIQFVQRNVFQRYKCY